MVSTDCPNSFREKEREREKGELVRIMTAPKLDENIARMFKQ